MNETIFKTDSVNDAAWLLVALPGRLRGFVFNGELCEMQFRSVNKDIEAALEQFSNGGTCSAREYVKSLSWLRHRVKELAKNQNDFAPRNNATQSASRPALTPQAV